MTRLSRFLIPLLLVALVVTGCAAPGQPSSVATPVVVVRAGAEEIVPTASPTQVSAALPIEEATEEPTEEPTPEPTATPVPPTATPSPIPPTATATVPPTATMVPTVAPTIAPTATPLPTAAVRMAQPTPMVVIPQGWPVYTDERLGYSVANPSTWVRVDLRGQSFQSLVRLFGSGAAGVAEELQGFLETPAGESIGIVAVEPDVTQIFSSAPFPAFLNVSVIDLPEGVTAQQLQAILEANVGLFGSVTVESSTVETINNLPAVRVIAQADLTEVGFPVTAYLEEVGLVANNKLYLLTLASKANLAARKRASFDGIIGSFRPE